MRWISIFLICLLGITAETFSQKEPLSAKAHQKLIYQFINDVLQKVGSHKTNNFIYLEEKVRGNKCYDSKPDRIFMDRIRQMDIKILDSLLTQGDIHFMTDQANNLLFKRWEKKYMTLKKVKVLPSAFARKNEFDHENSQYLGISLPFFSEDREKAIFFMCRQGIDDGWDAVALYQQEASGWKLVTTKLNLWHTK
ncbi:MAG: hypothetical protein ACPGJS_02540 [Flammeovirgaceae bacterium]